MITRVREEGDGYRVIVAGEGFTDERLTDSLTEAFAMQQAVQDTGKWPDGKEPKNGGA